MQMQICRKFPIWTVFRITRLQDDVTTIELQAVSGVVLAAIGLWYDDYIPGQSPSPVTPGLLGVLTYNAGPDKNDKPFRAQFPYIARPHRGYSYTKTITGIKGDDGRSSQLGFAPPAGFFTGSSYPNPSVGNANLGFHTAESGRVTVSVFDANGTKVAVIVNEYLANGDHSAEWKASDNLANGAYLVSLELNGNRLATSKIILNR